MKFCLLAAIALTRAEDIAARIEAANPIECRVSCGTVIVADKDFPELAQFRVGWEGRKYIILSPTMAKKSNDDELAFVIAHEMAHAWVRFERAADQMGAAMAERAGFSREGVQSILNIVGRN